LAWSFLKICFGKGWESRAGVGNFFVEFCCIAYEGVKPDDDFGKAFHFALGHINLAGFWDKLFLFKFLHASSSL